jgi:hypothetical protein
MLAIMVDPAAGHPTGLQHLVDEATELRERLHRITVALSITEDMVAEACDRLARKNGPGPTSAALKAEAQRARATADECRHFARHLDDVHKAQ